MSTGTAIRSALLQHVADRVSLPIVWPGQPHPAPDGTYVRVDWMPNGIGWPFINHDGTLEYPGMLQLTVMAPSGADAANQVTQMADALCGLFERGEKLYLEPGTLNMYKPAYYGQPYVAGDWVHAPVTFEYRAFV